ncbi:hypothetical protein NERG_01067 [Nematocida ausubeli]|uniref:Uncharacterized protein n=1 Tax=Nematocida ausubeli (strain ATCC PRA-371 / ERTm2) TaxID=1913371 RepID=H8ZCS0_NEMA1|nr:hypothetical protein NERG_01067 [Nematocida ausubeli]
MKWAVYFLKATLITIAVLILVGLYRAISKSIIKERKSTPTKSNICRSCKKNKDIAQKQKKGARAPSSMKEDKNYRKDLTSTSAIVSTKENPAKGSNISKKSSKCAINRHSSAMG